MVEVIEEHYIYEDILMLVKSIYSLVQSSHFLFNKYINNITLKAVFKQFKTDPCLLYRLNELGTVISI